MGCQSCGKVIKSPEMKCKECWCTPHRPGSDVFFLVDYQNRQTAWISRSLSRRLFPAPAGRSSRLSTTRPFLLRILAYGFLIRGKPCERRRGWSWSGLFYCRLCWSLPWLWWWRCPVCRWWKWSRTLSCVGCWCLMRWLGRVGRRPLWSA